LFPLVGPPEEGLKHALGHRGGLAPPMAGMFHDDRDRDSRLLHRGETDEPRVILELVGEG